jgi:PKD repeat protein
VPHAPITAPFGGNKVKSIRYRPFLLCVLLLIGASSAIAQYYPFPAEKPNTDVLCSACPSRETLLTIGYPPVLRWVGRWADAENVRDLQQNYRTARPRLARSVPSRNRLYTILGSGLAVYDTDRFFARLNARPQDPMVSATQIPVAGGNARNAVFGPPEVLLFWDAFFYAENGGGWITPFADGMERLFDFDWDDRGNVYLAYSIFGWGVVKDGGEKGGGWMTSVSQTVVTNSLAPEHIMSLKTSDGRYYVAVSDRTNPALLQIWDAQNPAVPVKQPDISGRSFDFWAKDSTGSRVAVVEYTGGLAIFTTDAFVRTGTPIVRLDAGGGGSFKTISSDGTNFYAYGAAGSGPFIDVISPSGGAYVEKRYSCAGYGVPEGMHYGDGYLALYGGEVGPDSAHPTNAGTSNIRVYKVAPGSLTEIPFEIPVPGKPGQQLPFWSMYYGGNAPSGYARPNFNNFKDVLPIKVGSKVYLVVAAYGLGDVWELKAGDSLTARVNSFAEAANPHSTAAAGSGPFYGDRQAFSSSLGSGTTANVSWDYGDSTTDASVTGGVVKHQYSGVTSTASLPLVRHVTASNVADPTMADSVTVTLTAPQPRFQLANTAYLFRQPDASSSAPIVAGDSFFDASDGAVEGHYTDWVLDGTSNKKLPSEAFGVGACGAHTLAFNTHYGPYSGSGNTLFSVTDLPLSISPFTYAVRPYVITVQEPTPDTIADPNAVFTTSLRVAGASDLPGGAGTAATYKWEVVNASNAAILTANGSSTLATIPPFSVPRTTFNTLGLKVRLTTTVAASAVPGTGCAGGATVVAESSVLNGPDPVIVKTGCLTVGAPCSFTVTSATNPTLAGWSFAWTVNPTVTSSGSNTSAFKPQFTTTTDYSVGVIVTNGIGSKTATLAGQHIDKPLCSSAPDNLNTFIGVFTNSALLPSESIPFKVFATGWTPSVECDKFDWTFGDGGTSAEMSPSHTYQTAGTYSVSLKLTGGLSTGNYTTSIIVGTSPGNGGGPGNGGPGNGGGGCVTPQANSAYIAYTGPASNCTAVVGACNPSELIQFVIWPDNGYNLSCGNTTITWAFGDGNGGSALAPAHAYTTAGIYHVQATVSNSAGNFTYTHDVQVGNAQPKPCGTLTQTSVSFGWTGTSCTETGGTCKPSDAVAFRPVGTGYDFSCTSATHSYDWDFGDGSAHSSLAQPTHSYNGPATVTVKLLVGNGSSSTTISRVLTVAAPGTGGNGDPCGTMIPDQNVYVTYYGDGCTAVAGSCNAKADVAFAVSSSGYNFDCAVHSYSWDFGDSKQSTDKAPTHRYTADGTYHVKVHVTAGTSSVDLIQTVKVVNGAAVQPRGGHAVRH